MLTSRNASVCMSAHGASTIRAVSRIAEATTLRHSMSLSDRDRSLSEPTSRNSTVTDLLEFELLDLLLNKGRALAMAQPDANTSLFSHTI